MRVFGPVPSRRFGQSLGINVMPSKSCTYSCAYCQIGRTENPVISRRAFAPVREVVEEVREVLERLRRRGVAVDYISFVPDGEPTLDENLGEEIACLAAIGIPILVITNGSLLWREDVRNDLRRADTVSVKVDAASEDVWRALNRPAEGLSLPKILDGIRAFAGEFQGRLVTETMLVARMNDSCEEVSRIARLIGELSPLLAWIDFPCRPPAENWAVSPAADALVAAKSAFEAEGVPVEVLTGEGGTEFGFTGDIVRDILAISSVHPISEEQMERILRRASADRAVVKRLVSEGRLVRIAHRGTFFYRRRQADAPTE